VEVEAPLLVVPLALVVVELSVGRAVEGEDDEMVLMLVLVELEETVSDIEEVVSVVSDMVDEKFAGKDLRMR